MTRSSYRKARRLLRDNGRFALRWLSKGDRDIFERLLMIQDREDSLAEKAAMCGDVWGNAK
jgi:hypothetical protein